MSGTAPPGSLPATGAVLEGLEGRINLRSLAPSFLAQFFPLDIARPHLRAEALFGYSPTEGTPALRARIAEAVQGYPDEIVVTDGASQAIFLILLATLAPGATILVPRPAFPAYLRIAAYRNCNIRFYEWRADGAALLERLCAADSGEIDAVILNSPHNPTGIALDGAAREAVATMLGRMRQRVILDDTYGWLDDGGAEQITHFHRFAAERPRAAGVAAVGSLGKLLCLPGLRLGFVMTRDPVLRDGIIEAKRHLVQASCSASEHLAAELLASAAWLEGRHRLVAALDQRRREFGRVTRHGVRLAAGGRGFYAYAGAVAPLRALGVDGIDGPVFEGAADEARYCLAASTADWSRFTAMLRDAPD